MPPPGLTVTALSGPGWVCTVPTRTCTRSDALAPGASYPAITVATSVDAGAAPGVVPNTAVVSVSGESNSTNNTAEDPTVIAVPAPGMDLTITKRHSQDTVVQGQTFLYIITVLNVGSSPSSGPVTVTETPPAGLTVTALSGPGWTCTVATGTCTRSDALAPASSYPEITVTTVVGASVVPGTVTNTAVVSGGGDSNTGNNTATDPTVITSPVGGPDLTLTKAQSEGVVVAGQPIKFTIRVTNVGSGSTSGQVTVTEATPPGLTITELSGSGWTCFVATQTCLRADALAPSASYPDITVTAVIPPAAVGTIVNGAVVSGGGDSNPGNNTASATVPLAPVADIQLTKSADNPTPTVGEPVVFTVQAVNAGPSPATGVQITDSLPVGLTFISVAPSQGTYDSSTGAWSVGSLAVGAMATLQLTARVDVAGQIVNVADEDRPAISSIRIRRTTPPTRR